jgi:hypothetical protein
MHLFPKDAVNYVGQYLQFDGYPSNQMYRIMSEMKLLSNIGDKKTPRKFKLDYLESYYNFRSYDSYHSIRGGAYCGSLYTFNEYNPDTGNYNGFDDIQQAETQLSLKETVENMFVEYLYEWIIDIEEPELRITHISTGNVIKFKIKDLANEKNRESVIQSIEEFSEKTEIDLEALEDHFFGS